MIPNVDISSSSSATSSSNSSSDTRMIVKSSASDNLAIQKKVLSSLFEQRASTTTYLKGEALSSMDLHTAPTVRAVSRIRKNSDGDRLPSTQQVSPLLRRRRLEKQGNIPTSKIDSPLNVSTYPSTIDTVIGGVVPLTANREIQRAKDLLHVNGNATLQIVQRIIADAEISYPQAWALAGEAYRLMALDSLRRMEVETTLGNWRRAKMYVSTALRLDPTCEDTKKYHEDLIRDTLPQRLTELAERLLETNLQTVIKILNFVVDERDDSYFRAWSLIGEAYLRIAQRHLSDNRNDEADKTIKIAGQCLKRALALNSTCPLAKASVDWLFDYLMENAKNLFHQKQYREARNFLFRILELSENHLNAWVLIAQLYDQEGRGLFEDEQFFKADIHFTFAMECFDQAVALAPKDARILNYRASFYVERGPRYYALAVDDVCSMFEGCENLRDEDDKLLCLKVLKSIDKRLTRRRKELHKLELLFKSESDPLKTLPSIVLEGVKKKEVLKKEGVKIEVSCSSERSINPSMVDSIAEDPYNEIIMRSRELLEEESYEEVIKILMPILEKQDIEYRYPKAWIFAGEAYRQQGIFYRRNKKDEDADRAFGAANVCFEKALDIDPYNIFALNYRARFYSQRGLSCYSLALTDLNLVLQLSKNHPFALDLKKEILEKMRDATLRKQKEIEKLTTWKEKLLNLGKKKVIADQ